MAAVAIIPLLVLLGAVVGVVVLLAIPRTRLIGLGILAAGLVLVFVWYAAVSVRVERSGAVATRSASRPVVVLSPLEGTPSSAPVALTAPPPSPSAAAGAGSPSVMLPGNVLTALGQAISSAIAKTDKKFVEKAAAIPAERKAVSQQQNRLTAKESREQAPSVTRPHSNPLPQGEGTKPASPDAGPVATKRPEWVDAPAKYVDNAYLMPVSVGPYTTRLECEAKLPEAVQSAAAEYSEILLGEEAGRRIALPPAEELRRQLVTEQWDETVRSSMGPMVQLHARLTFDGKVHQRIQDAWRQVLAAERLRLAGLGLAAVLTLLAVTYGYLKWDQSTAGRYRGWLRLAASAAVVVVVLAVLALIS